MTTYAEALALIHQRPRLKKKPTLSRMALLLSRLGDPHKNLPIIHVAGTNGKGSTIAYLSSVFQAAGSMVGTFTSPFLMRFNERISVNGQPITDAELVTLFDRVNPIVEQLDQELTDGGPTEFEMITAMMFCYFQSHPVDVLIVEVGIGGKYDSTNVLQPVLSIITSVSYDHMALLGNNITQIAAQKAGIIKPDTAVIMGEMVPKAQAVVKEVAKQNNSHLYQANVDFQVVETNSSNWEQRFNYCADQEPNISLVTSLMGNYQLVNASLAIKAYQVWCQLTNQPVNNDAIQKGIAQTRWAGRFEKISNQPLVVLDGAHNVDAATKLKQLLTTHFHDYHIEILMATLADKQFEQMLGQMAAIENANITLTQFMAPLNRQVENPLNWLTDSGLSGIKVASDWHESLMKLMANADDKTLILVTGSLYFISEVRSKLTGAVNKQ